MDDPNFMQNLTSISPDQKDNMTSISTPKRTIVLGVVNTAGMKSANANRKRRWDQPPEDVTGTHIAKKACISECDTFPVKENESPETVNTVIPTVDRVNSQSDSTSFSQNQIVSLNTTENEDISIVLEQSHHEHISSEASAMSIDLPEDGIDRLTPSTVEHCSENALCSETVEKLSEVNILENCDRLMLHKKLDSPPADSRLGLGENSNKEESFGSNSEIKNIKHEQKSNVAATFISHQSDELRRIMFSYDEGSSDSDTMDTNNFKDENASTLTSEDDKVGVDKDMISSTMDLSDELKNAVSQDNPINNIKVVCEEPNVSDNSYISISSPHLDVSETPTSIQPEYNSREKDAFIESNSSLENSRKAEESLIESQDNIPACHEPILLTNSKIDSLVSEVCHPHEENIVGNEINSHKSIKEGPTENLLEKEAFVADSGLLLPPGRNSPSESNKFKYELGIKSLDQIYRCEESAKDKSEKHSDEHIIVCETSVAESIISLDKLDCENALLAENKMPGSPLHDKQKEIKTDLIVGVEGDDSSAQGCKTVNQVSFNEVVSNEGISCDTGQLTNDNSLHEIMKVDSPNGKNIDIDPLIENNRLFQCQESSPNADNPPLEECIKNEEITAEVPITSDVIIGLDEVEINQDSDLNLDHFVTAEDKVEESTKNMSKNEKINSTDPSSDSDHYSPITEGKIIQIDEEPNNSSTTNIDSNDENEGPGLSQGMEIDVSSSVNLSNENDDFITCPSNIEFPERSSDLNIIKGSDTSFRETYLKDEKISEDSTKYVSECESKNMNILTEEENLFTKEMKHSNDGSSSKNASSVPAEVVSYSELQTSCTRAIAAVDTIDDEIVETDSKNNTIIQSYGSDILQKNLEGGVEPKIISDFGKKIEIIENECEKKEEMGDSMMTKVDGNIAHSVLDKNEDVLPNIVNDKIECTIINECSSLINAEVEKSYKSIDTDINNIDIGAAMEGIETEIDNGQSAETEIEEIQNPDAEIVFVESGVIDDINVDEVISKTDPSIGIGELKDNVTVTIIAGTDNDISSNAAPIPMKHGEMEITTGNIEIDNSFEEFNTRIDGSKTKVSTIKTETVSNSDEIEISTEETIETEISTEENVENELCALENDESNAVETKLNLVDKLGHKVNTEQNVLGLCLDHNVEKDVKIDRSKNDSAVELTETNNHVLEEKIEIDGNKDFTESLGIEKENISTERSKDSVILEEVTTENSTLDECLYSDSSINVAEEGLEIDSVDNASYEGVLSQSPEESKNFVESIDVSETVVADETVVDGDSVVDSEILIEDETKTEVRSPTDSDISFVEENLLTDQSKTITDDIESFVVEEVVTCESLESDKGENALDTTNDDISSPSTVMEETLDVINPSSAVIKENIGDHEVSNNKQNKIYIDWNLELKKPNELNLEGVKKHTGFSKDLKNEPLLNSIKSIEMECETPINSITKPLPSFAMEEMEVDLPPVEMSDANLKQDSIKVERSLMSIRNSDFDLPKTVKDAGVNIPLLKTVTNSISLRKEKPPTPVDEISRSGSIPCLDPKLEPITLRIYKDNLSVKTDDLDSPKKNKSPKLSSELKSQHSPHIKSSDNRSSLSPTTKKLEFTLKIAKDVNTNIPRATMSPKNNVSPSSIHKSGDILRAELTGESGRNSPAYVNPDSASNKVKLKISKQSSPSLSKEYSISHLQTSSIKEDVLVQSDGISLPKPPIEIENVFKKMMETEKNIEIKGEIIGLDHSLISNPITPTSTPLVKKRGRPRKILHKVLTQGVNDPNLSLNLIADPNSATSVNHSPVGFDVSSGLDNSDQMSSRQVRSCRARTKPIVVKTRKPRGGGVGRGGMRGRGGGNSVAAVGGGMVRLLAPDKDPEKLAEKLSEKEKAELAKIEERKERQRLERIAKNEAKKAKKLARKLKDEERRLKRLREKAEKAEAAAPQVFEEETRMSAPDGGSRGHTPAPASALSRLNQTSEHNEESQNSISTPTSSQIKRGRMEIPIDPESKEVRVDQLAEYQWQGSELFMIQEQVSLYLGVKSFKRKYPDLKRRPVEAEERTFLEDSGLVPKSMCDLGLTAVSSAEVLDVMYHDFPEKYEEFRRYVREKQAREASFKQKAVFANLKQDRSKGEPREQALEAVAMWNSNLNRERREERRCALDLQTFTVHYPKQIRDKMSRPLPKAGLYPVSLIPGQFSDCYKVYTPTELMYFPLNTVMYGPLKPNERQPINPSDGSGSDSSSSSTSDDSSSSSSDCESDDERGGTRECKICNGEKKTNKESHPEILLQCSNCKGLCHPTCQEITPEMLPHIKKYNWHCSNCKKCMQCKNTSKDDKMLFCDLCDRGYHIHCVGLRKAPEGRWHCSVCSFCTVCGSKDSGGPEWNYEYKKTDKGVRLYQRTLCVPCSKNALM